MSYRIVKCGITWFLDYSRNNRDWKNLVNGTHEYCMRAKRNAVASSSTAGFKNV